MWNQQIRSLLASITHRGMILRAEDYRGKKLSQEGWESE